MKISVDDIAFSVVFTTVFTCRRSEILDPTNSSKIFFSANNTFHLIIMMISVVLCKINEFSTTTWSGFDCAIDRQNYREIVTKCVATDVMLGIYNLMIWTICHKLISIYRNAISLHIIFVVTHGEIFSHLSHTGPLTVNKMALPSRYRRIWRHIHAFIGRNTIALRVQRFAADANIICLTYATDWWAVIGPVIHGESNLRPLGSRSSSDQVGLLR